MPNTTCIGPECERPGKKRGGMCDTHYRQHLKGHELRPIARRLKGATQRDEQGRKWCQYCGLWQDESEFSPHAKAQDGLRGNCKTCSSAQGKSDYTRVDGARRRLAKYKLTPEMYEAMFEAQGGCCVTCKTTESGARAWSIDHDHSCCPGPDTCGNCVRGILCNRCNSALGMARDNPETLLRMVEYLGTFKNPTDREYA